MGLHSDISNRKKRHGSCASSQRRKLIRANKTAKVITMEGVELLSKPQLKKLAKNPTNNIRPSGKRKRKVIKRLNHHKREKNLMQVETEASPGPSTSGKAKKSKKGAAVTDTDVEKMET